MNKKVFKQTDSRWAKLAYPTKPYTIGGSGCGEVGMCNLLIDCPQYVKYTPKTIYKYMKQFAVAGDGTKRAGIATAMKHYGFRNVTRIGSDPMSEVWKLMSKGYVGLFVMRAGAGGSKGVTWTTSGHYIAVIGYKVKDGKHYVYCKDSGWRNHDGWYCYENSMEGVVDDAILGLKPKTKAQKISDMAVKLSWKAGTPKKKYDGQTGKPCAAYKKAWKKAFGTNPNTGCDSFVKLVLKKVGYGTMSTSSWSNTNKWLRKKFKRIKPKTKNGKILKNQFKNGDIVYWAKSDGSHHIYIIVRKNKKWYRAEAVQHGYRDRRGDKWSHLGKGLNLDTHKVDYIYRAK